MTTITLKSTLLEMVEHENETIRRNALSILKTARRLAHATTCKHPKRYMASGTAYCIACKHDTHKVTH